MSVYQLIFSTTSKPHTTPVMNTGWKPNGSGKLHQCGSGPRPHVSEPRIKCFEIAEEKFADRKYLKIDVILGVETQ